MTLSDQEHQIVRVGYASASLLANDDFQQIIKALMVEGFATFTESKPHQADAREQTYNLIQGLKAIESELSARVQAKDEILRRINADDESTDDSALIDDAELGSQE